MNVRIHFQTVCAAAATILLASCAGEEGIAQQVREFSIRPAKIGVIDVREKDLKPLPTGEEQALAYQRSSRRFSMLFKPVDFKEPDLPSGGFPMDGGLLPSMD